MRGVGPVSDDDPPAEPEAESLRSFATGAGLVSGVAAIGFSLTGTPQLGLLFGAIAMFSGAVGIYPWGGSGE